MTVIAPNSAFSWILIGMPCALLLLGLGMFIVRLAKLGKRSEPDSGQVLLGAVSQSLQERGELAASLGALRTVHERILDALPFGILWIDHARHVAALNAEGRRLLEVSAGVVGLDATFVLDPFPWLLEGLGREAGASWRCDGAGRRWQLQRIEAPDKVGALLQFQDITELEVEERRTQLRERFAELGEMTAGVAHQLKNGLAVLKGHGQLLERAGHGEAAQALLQETGELEQLAQRFLQWAKPLEPECMPIQLEEAALQAVREIQKRPVSQGRLLVVEGAGAAMADPMLLHQALVNLLENACQATPERGRIRIQVADQRLEILDEGPGMPASMLARMMRPFESGRPDGTGLGLPLALKWLNAQGADLSFAKKEPEGTQVLIQW